MLEIYTDGASRSNPGESSFAYIFVENGLIKKVHAEYIGIRTNNEAEYIAVISALKDAIKDGVKNLTVFSDSLLLISQINGIYKIKAENIKRLYKELQDLISKFNEIKFVHVTRENGYTKIADKLTTVILGPK